MDINGTVNSKIDQASTLSIYSNMQENVLDFLLLVMITEFLQLCTMFTGFHSLFQEFKDLTIINSLFHD